MSHNNPDYDAAIADFSRNERDCFLAEAILANGRCVDIAWNFNRTPEQVANDIIKHIKQRITGR